MSGTKHQPLQHWNPPLCNKKCPISTVSMTVKDDKLLLKLLSFTALGKKILLFYSPYRNTCQKLQQTSLQTLQLKGIIFKNSFRKKKIFSRQGNDWDACRLSRSLWLPWMHCPTYLSVKNASNWALAFTRPKVMKILKICVSCSKCC